MKSRLWITLAGLVVATLAPAQSFDKLWKDYDAAIEADRPRTALSVAETIARKALDKDDDGQLVKALFAERSLWGTLSPDSMTAATARLERREGAGGTPRRGQQFGIRQRNAGCFLFSAHILKSLRIIL